MKRATYVLAGRVEPGNNAEQRRLSGSRCALQAAAWLLTGNCPEWDVAPAAAPSPRPPGSSRQYYAVMS